MSAIVIIIPRKMRILRSGWPTLSVCPDGLGFSTECPVSCESPHPQDTSSFRFSASVGVEEGRGKWLNSYFPQSNDNLLSEAQHFLFLPYLSLTLSPACKKEGTSCPGRQVSTLSWGRWPETPSGLGVLCTTQQLPAEGTLQPTLLTVCIPLPWPT